MIREFSQSVFFIGIAKNIINGDEYLLLAGKKSNGFYAGKVYKNNLAEYEDFTNVIINWIKIDSDYDVRDLTLIPIPSTSTVTMSNLTSATVSITDMATDSQNIEEHVALWLDDFNETYLPNNKIEIKSIWA